jgi:hypothetical protein
VWDYYSAQSAQAAQTKKAKEDKDTDKGKKEDKKRKKDGGGSPPPPVEPPPPLQAVSPKIAATKTPTGSLSNQNRASWTEISK